MRHPRGAAWLRGAVSIARPVEPEPVRTGGGRASIVEHSFCFARRKMLAIYRPHVSASRDRRSKFSGSRKLTVFASLASLCFAAPSNAQFATYKRGGLWGGYSDKELEPGIWRVRASANGVSGGARLAADMAMYRAAEIAREHGFKYFRVLKVNGIQMIMSRELPINAGGNVEVTIRPVSESDDNSECRSKDLTDCKTYEADSTMNELRQYIKFPRSN